MTMARQRPAPVKEPATGSEAKVYLAGSQSPDWREHAKGRLRAQAVDPMDRGSEGANYQAFVERSKDDILSCQALLVMDERPTNAGTVGASMEVLFGWERGRFVVVVVPADAYVSPWLRYHATRIFTKLDDAIDWLNREL